MAFRGFGSGQSGIYTFIAGTLALVADLSTPIPGGSGNFVNFRRNPVSLGGGDVAFRGVGSSGQRGIYTFIGGTLALVADLSTLIPGGTGTFTNLDNPVSLGGVDVAFEGDGSSGQSGIYTDISGTLALVADLSTAIPGGTGTFTILGDPVSLGGGDVAFVGEGSGQRGIYTYISGTLAVVADTSTPIPGGSGTFTAHGNPVFLGGGDVAFVGTGTGQSGIYTFIAGTLALVADENTSIPGGSGTFTQFFDPVSLGGGDVAFRGNGSGELGIYTFISGTLAVLVDRNTLIPGGTGTFTGFGNPLSLGGVDVAFLGVGSLGQQGIYTFIAGTLAVLADTNTPIPGGSGTFTSINPVSLDGGDVAFLGRGSSGQEGIYTFIAGTLALVADLSTPIPGGVGTFTNFNLPVSLGGGDVAFLGRGPLSQSGIYTFIGGTQVLVADENMMIPGGLGNFTSFSNPVSLGGGDVAFLGRGSGQVGIYNGLIDTGSLTIVKETDPDGATGFGFTGTGFPPSCALDGGFTLDDDGFEDCDLIPGTYTVQETNTQGFAITDIDCVGASSFSETADSVTVDLEVDEIVVCTFTNTINEVDLHINLAGNGTGNVSAPGIDCGDGGIDCMETYDFGTVVNLIPTPGPGSHFVDWTGDPDCADAVVTMNMDILCTAAFNRNIAPPRSADISVIKSGSPNPVDVGAELTYSFMVHNSGPDTAPGVQLMDILPTSLTFVSASAGCVNNSGTVTCGLGSIPNGGNTSVSIVVIPTEPGAITNGATANSFGVIDPNQGNNTSTITTEVVGDITEFLMVEPDFEDITTGPGGMVSIPVEISNPVITETNSLTQTKQTATGVVFTVDIPEGFDIVDLITTQGTCDIDTLECVLGDILPGQTVTVVVDAVAPEGDGVFIVSFTVSTSTGQTFTGNVTIEVTGGGEGGSGGGCAVAGANTRTASLAGLLLYALLPIAIVARRRFRKK